MTKPSIRLVRRLCPTTVVVFLLVTAVGVVVNWGGDLSLGALRISHGTPWVFAESLGGFPAPLWTLPPFNEWRLAALAGDVAVVLLVATAIAAGWQWRRSYRARWYQFSLFDGLVAISIVAGFLGYGASLYREGAAYKRFSRALTERQIGVRTDGAIHEPYLWFWELCRVPKESRPQRVRWLTLEGSQSSGALPEEGVWRELRHFRSLSRMDISNVDVPESGFAACASARMLTEFNLRGTDDADVAALARLQSLEVVRLEGERITDEGLRALARLANLKQLQLFRMPLVHGATLGELKRLTQLELQDCAVNSDGLKQIATLQTLSKIEFEFWTVLPPEDWSNLASSSVQNFSLTADSLQEDAFASFPMLRNLETFSLNSKSLPKLDPDILIRQPTLRFVQFRLPAANLSDEFHERLRERKIEIMPSFPTPW